MGIHPDLTALAVQLAIVAVIAVAAVVTLCRRRGDGRDRGRERDARPLVLLGKPGCHLCHVMRRRGGAGAAAELRPRRSSSATCATTRSC